MWEPEVVLRVRRPNVTGGQDDVFPIGSTTARGVVSAVMGQLVAEAERDAERWSEDDPVLAAAAEAEAARLSAIAETLDWDEQADLRLVRR